MKRILITGANSYIGENVRDYLLQEPEKYSVVIKDTIKWEPKPEDFDSVDVVFNVAGIAHIKETKDNRHIYYDVNRDLVVKIADAAKQGGVKQFILLSTMAVYGLTTGHITKTSKPKPANAYGKSKIQADNEIERMADESFKFVCLRPPMVYGKGCKGNYQSLRSFALKSPIFPDFYNQRSMIYIGNLCDFVKCCIDNEREGLFFPQNVDYVCTRDMVKQIADNNGKVVKFTKAFNWSIRIVPLNVVKKVFGSLTYEKTDLVDTFGFKESVAISER